MTLMNFLVGWTHLRKIKSLELEGMEADISKSKKKNMKREKIALKTNKE